MSDTAFARDPNFVPVSGAVTDDANLETRPLRVDPATNRLKVTATTDIDTDGDGHAQVDVLTMPEVSIDTTGLATEAKQDTGNTSLATLAGAVSGTEVQVDVVSAPTLTVEASDLDVRDLTSTDVVTVTGGAGQTADVKVTLDSESVAVTGTFWQATQPVSAASLPLPTGAATEASLASIDGKITACNTGSIAGTVTANAGTNLNTSALALETGGNLASIKTNTDKIPSLGQAAMAASVPVTMASNQGDIKITLDSEAVVLGAGSAAIGKLAANSGVDIGDVDVLSLPAVTIAAAQTLATVTTVGAVTSITNALPAGTNTIGAAELDGTALGNNQVTVDSTLNGTTILAASAGRQGAIITNQGSVDCYIGTGNVSASNGFLLKAGESLALPTDSEIKGFTASSSTVIGYLSFA